MTGLRLANQPCLDFKTNTPTMYKNPLPPLDQPPLSASVHMAAKPPQLSLLVANPHIDLCFDLDLAMTWVENTTEISMSSSIVSAMPSVTAADDACTVCREGFEYGEAGKQLPCGHAFHPGCIASWLSLSSSCPLCRRRVSAGTKQPNWTPRESMFSSVSRGKQHTTNRKLKHNNLNRRLRQ